MNNDYSVDTCNEIVEILNHIPKELYDKLPDDVVNYFYQNADGNNEHFKYNVALPILKQDIKQETKEVVLFLYRVFWKKEML